MHYPIKYFWCFTLLLMVCCRTTPGKTGKSHDTHSMDESEDSDQDIRDRTVWQKPYEVIHLLGSLDGKTIADIGAGSGYFAFRFIHEAEKVIAIDIDDDLIKLMNQEKQFYRQELQQRIETRLATKDNPMLKDNEVDFIFVANTYPYIGNRVAYFRRLIPKFKPGGKLMIVDFKKKGTPIGPSQKNRLAQSDVEQELIDAGYKIKLSDDLRLEYQYIIIASPE